LKAKYFSFTTIEVFFFKKKDRRSLPIEENKKEEKRLPFDRNWIIRG
jgi:hypothetical protein